MSLQYSKATHGQLTAESSDRLRDIEVDECHVEEFVHLLLSQKALPI
ncbi:hypothetical protein ERO13_A11G268350v2 [Gossypium hirsutum]|nr:hypothetical protein ERO13_A11G268350v2 [Gossypium hirsutum]